MKAVICVKNFGGKIILMEKPAMNAGFCVDEVLVITV